MKKSYNVNGCEEPEHNDDGDAGARRDLRHVGAV